MLHDAKGRDARIGGIFALAGDKQVKRTMAQAGDTVALARLEPFVTGEMLSTAKSAAAGGCAYRAPDARFIAWPSRRRTARTRSS